MREAGAESPAILINPHARVNRRHPLQPDWVRGHLGRDTLIIETGGVAEVGPAVSRILEAGRRWLIVAGGDGTLHTLVTELLRARPSADGLPSLLLLRGGTMNMAANNLSTRRRPIDEIEVLGRAQANGIQLHPDGVPSRTIAPLCLERGGDTSPLYGFVFANGIAFNILKEYYKGEGSVSRAFNITASLVFGSFLNKEMEKRYFPNLPAVVRVDEDVVSRRPLRISVAAAAPKLLLWFEPFTADNGGIAAGGFYFLANFMKTRKIARHFWPLCRGTYRGSHHVNRIARDVVIEGGGGFTLDGEIYDDPEPGSGLRLSCGPRLEFMDLSRLSDRGTWMP